MTSRDLALVPDVPPGRNLAWDADAPAKPMWLQGTALAGLAAVLVGLGGFLGFAALAPVASAVVAPGVVAGGTDRQKVQHAEGGIVREIRVGEGSLVAEGDVLFRLDPLQAEVGAGIVAANVASTAALEARLLAEREGRPAPVFPEAVLAAGDVGRRAAEDQLRLFGERRASLDAQVAVLQARIAQASDAVSGRERERDANVAQLHLIRDELGDARTLLAQRLVARPRVLALEREEARLSGAIGAAEAEISRNRGVAEESRREIARLRGAFAERVGEELRTVSDRLAELRQQARQAVAVLGRVEVRAPRDGIVQGLRVTTLGEVVAPGGVLLEIAPAGAATFVTARVRPDAVDSLAPGMPAQLRFPGLPARTTPVVEGAVVSVSGDRLVDPATNESYFLVRVAIEPGATPAALLARLTAGVPAEVVVPTGERTFLDYLVRPIGDALARGLRER